MRGAAMTYILAMYAAEAERVAKARNVRGEWRFLSRPEQLSGTRGETVLATDCWAERRSFCEVRDMQGILARTAALVVPITCV